MKKWLLSCLPIIFLACQSGPDLIPLDESPTGNPGDYIEVRTESPLVQERFEYLQEYLEKTNPHILPLEVVRAFGQVVDGKNVILVCSYSQGGKDSWLKAEILGDREGNITGRTIQAGYRIEKLEEDL